MKKRQFLVTLYPAGGEERDTAIVDEGKVRPMKVRSRWLVASGQELDVAVIVSEIRAQDPGSHLIDATRCLWRPATPDAPGVVIAQTHDYRFIPSERPLYAVLEDAIRHGEKYPKHGPDCSCMDTLAYELKRHVSRVLPTDAPYGTTKEWEDSFNARMRIKHLLNMVARNL